MFNGFTDTWKGNHCRELVCIKAIRLRRLEDAKEIKRVRNSFIFSEMYSVRFLTDILSRNGQSSSECTLNHRGFGHIISALHHESVDARWEYHPVHQGEPGSQSADAGTCPSSRILMWKTCYLRPQQLAQACQGLMYLHGLSILHGGIAPVGKLEE